MKDHDALLLTGNRALRQRRGVRGYPYRYDLGEEWREWTGLPFVFRRWVARSEMDRQDLVVLEDRAVRWARRLDQQPLQSHGTQGRLANAPQGSLGVYTGPPFLHRGTGGAVDSAVSGVSSVAGERRGLVSALKRLYHRREISRGPGTWTRCATSSRPRTVTVSCRYPRRLSTKLGQGRRELPLHSNERSVVHLFTVRGAKSPLAEASRRSQHVTGLLSSDCLWAGQDDCWDHRSMLEAHEPAQGRCSLSDASHTSQPAHRTGV